jgi:hypothetical protein
MVGVTNYCPLSPQEMKFAKAFKIHTKMENARREFMTAKENGCETEIAEARTAMNHAREMRIENQHMFSRDFWWALHGIEFQSGDDFLAELAERRARSGQAISGLPEGDFILDKFTNAVQLGMGSRIPLGHFSLHIFDDIIGAFENHIQNPQNAADTAGRVRSVYPQALSWLLHAANTGNSSLNTSKGLLNEHDLNANVLSLLQKMGVDTSRTFSINGTNFEVHNGKVQTQGYTRNPNQKFIGAEGMQQLLDRANAQNLFNGG